MGPFNLVLNLIHVHMNAQKRLLLVHILCIIILLLCKFVLYSGLPV